jgi:hypothetical protein
MYAFRILAFKTAASHRGLDPIKRIASAFSISCIEELNLKLSFDFSTN